MANRDGIDIDDAYASAQTALDEEIGLKLEDLLDAADERDALRAPWTDKDDEYTARITAAHPMMTGDHKTYRVALEMIGNRHSKYALVNLVNWLLRDLDEARANALREAAARGRMWLRDWAVELAGTFEEYVKAKTSGRFMGRPIGFDAASAYAREFKAMAEAIDNCAEPLGKAIEAMIQESKP
jgi:hypothetical protein